MIFYHDRPAVDPLFRSPATTAGVPFEESFTAQGWRGALVPVQRLWHEYFSAIFRPHSQALKPWLASGRRAEAGVDSLMCVVFL